MRCLYGAGETKYQPAHGHDKLLERTCESCYGSGKEKISPELKARMYAELAQYVRPKRKAIEHTVERVGSIAETLRQRRQERNALEIAECEPRSLTPVH